MGEEFSAGFPPHLCLSSSSSSSSSLQRESAVDLCSSSSSSSDQETQACLLFINIRTGPSLSSQPAGGEAKLQQIMQIQTRYICSASELIGHGVLKKAVCVVFFSCVCSLTVQALCVCMCACVCVCVCVAHPKAACAPLFQMTLFTDITQPPRIPRQNLISRERHSRDPVQREIFASRLQTCTAFH